MIIITGKYWITMKDLSEMFNRKDIRSFGWPIKCRRLLFCLWIVEI